jgi:hypothetical protein
MVQEFKIEPDELSNKREAKVRLAGWGSIGLLVSTPWYFSSCALSDFLLIQCLVLWWRSA